MQLTPYQQLWLLRIRASDYRHALFCKAGTGKTIAMLAACQELPIPWIIFCRRKDIPMWTEAIRKCTGTYTVESVDNVPPPPSTSRPYGVIVDESYHVKNAFAKRHRRIRTWCDRARAVLLANADPVVSSVLDLHGQMRLVIGEAHLNAVQMRNKYFARDLRGFGCHEKPSSLAEYTLHRDVQRHATFYTQPTRREIVRRVIPIRLSPDAAKNYKELVTKLETTVKDEDVQLTHAMEKAIKLHQIAGGFLPTPKATYCLKPNAKAMWLQSKVAAIRRDSERVVVWCAYRHEVTWLSEWLQVPRWMGGDEAPPSDADVVIATLDMGVSTNFFSQFQHSVYYSQSFKFILQSQSLFRTNRYDSRHTTCHYYFLVARGTIDEHIHKVLEQRAVTKKELFDINKIKSYYDCN